MPDIFVTYDVHVPQARCPARAAKSSGKRVGRSRVLGAACGWCRGYHAREGCSQTSRSSTGARRPAPRARGRRARLLQERQHGGVAQVVRPVPGPVAGVVGRVHLGAQAQQQLRALQPALVGGRVQRRAAGRLHLVHALARRQRRAHRCAPAGCRWRAALPGGVPAVRALALWCCGAQRSKKARYHSCLPLLAHYCACHSHIRHFKQTWSPFMTRLQ